jgi:hypothetical protein
MSDLWFYLTYGAVIAALVIALVVDFVVCKIRVRKYCRIAKQLPAAMAQATAVARAFGQHSPQWYDAARRVQDLFEALYTIKDKVQHFEWIPERYRTYNLDKVW